MTEQEKLELIIKTLDSKRGEDIQAIKISDLTILADYFVINSCGRGGVCPFTEGHGAPAP